MVLYLVSNLILFGSIPCLSLLICFTSRVSLQKELPVDGSNRNLPEPADKPAIYGTVKTSEIIN